MELRGFDRIRLIGDEECGVGLDCLDCWDGGRPLAYLGDGYEHDEKVSNVDSMVGLLLVGRAHLDEHHHSEDS